MVEAFAQAGFQSVVAGVRDARDLTDRSVDAIIWIGQRASRIQAPLVYVIFGGYGTRFCRRRTAGATSVDAWNIDRRISFNESRQSYACGADVAGLKQPVRAERTLNIQVPIVRVGQM